MITLAAASTIQGVAGSATAITVSIFGDEVSTGDAFKKLYQGQLPSSAGVLYTVPGSTQALVKAISLVNTTAGPVTVTLFVDGTAAANRVVNLTVPANGFASYSADGWKVYDATGQQLFVGAQGSQGIQGIQGEKGWSPVLAVVTDGARRVFQITSWVGGAGTPPPSTNQFIGAAGIVGTAAAAVDIRGAAGADGVTQDISGKFDKLNGVLTGVASPTYAAGKLVYDTDNESLTFFNNDSNIAMQVGQEQWIRVRNVSGSTINNGQAVYITGANSGLPTIGLARADSATTATCVGLATENIANNTIGYVTTAGVVRGLNTASFAAGATVYLSPTTAGGLTNVRPVSPNLSQRVGVVIDSHASTGSIHVSPVGTGASMYFDIVLHGGADYTGVADATTIIQNAINTVGAAGGGIVFIPIGTFKTSAAITVTNPFVTIMGASRVKSKIVPTHATGDVFQVQAAGIFTRFETFRIEPTSFTARTADYGINVQSGASNCSVQWVDMLGMWSGIKATGQLCRIEDANLREMGYGAVNGCVILIDSFTDQYIRCVVSDHGTVAPNAPQSGFSGIRITNLSSLLMADCQIIHCGNGMDLSPASTNTIPSIKCMNTFFDQGTIGLRVNPGSGSVLRSTFIGCWFSGNSTSGALLNGTNINGLDFIGCEFYGAPSQPIGIDAAAATEWSVRASRIAGNSTAGIRTTAGAAHAFSISDCVIGPVGGVGANALGINIQAGTYARYQVLDNRGLELNTTPGITDAGTTPNPSVNKNVANNMGTLRVGVANKNIATQAVAAATATYITGSAIPVPTNGWTTGTILRWRIRGATSAAAGTAANSILFKVGTLGTTGDATVATVATAVGTAVTAIPFSIVAEMVVTAVGAAANAYYAIEINNRTATGFINAAADANHLATGTAFNSGTANLIAGIVLTTGASKTVNITSCVAEVVSA